MLQRFPCLLLLLALAAGLTATPVERAAQALYRQGLALERDKKYEQAVAKFDAALAADATLVQAQRELARCFYQLGWRDQALDHLRLYLDSGVSDPPFRAFYDALAVHGEAIGAFDSVESPPPLLAQGPLCLQAELGYGWGFNNANFGHRYNASNNANPFTYSYEVGEGIAGQVEAVYNFSPNIGLGLSVRPLSTDTSGGESIDYNGVSTTSDSTQVRELAFPILLNLHVRSRLGPNLKLTGFFGAGAVFSQPYVETSSDVESDSSGTYTTSVRYQSNLDPGLALSGGLGMEFLLSAHLSLFLRGSLLLAQMAPSSATYTSDTYNASGSLVASSTATNTYVSAVPKTQATDPVSTPGGGGTTTTTYDNGPTQYTEVVTPGSDTFTESNLLASGTDLVSFKVLNATVGLRWEF